MRFGRMTKRRRRARLLLHAQRDRPPRAREEEVLDAGRIRLVSKKLQAFYVEGVMKRDFFFPERVGVRPICRKYMQITSCRTLCGQFRHFTSAQTNPNPDLTLTLTPTPTLWGARGRQGQWRVSKKARAAESPVSTNMMIVVQEVIYA